MNTPTQTPQPLSPEVLKEHRRKICEGLIEGRQGQIRRAFDNPKEQWNDYPSHICGPLLFSDDYLDYLRVRLKPEPRKCWVGWQADGTVVLALDNSDKLDMSSTYAITNWTEVTEQLP